MIKRVILFVVMIMLVSCVSEMKRVEIRMPEHDCVFKVRQKVAYVNSSIEGVKYYLDIECEKCEKEISLPVGIEKYKRYNIGDTVDIKIGRIEL